MNTREFLEQLLDKYSALTRTELSDDMLGPYSKIVLFDAGYKTDTGQIKRNQAARISHEFLKYTLKEEDVDWNDARNLKDIYDCKICANPVAQVYEKGIIDSREKDIFGMEDILTEIQLSTIIERLSKRISKQDIRQ